MATQIIGTLNHVALINKKRLKINTWNLPFYGINKLASFRDYRSRQRR